MSAAVDRSGRWSGRVASDSATFEVRPSLGRDSAPETPTSRGAPGSASEHRSQRVSRRRLERIDADLSERERSILVDLDRFRFLTSSQVQVLHFRDHATEDAAARIRRRVLERLARYRVIEHLERRVGGIRAGSASYVWRVGVVGDRLLRRQRGDGGRSRRTEPSARHLDHCLAVAACHIQLVVAAREGQLDLLTTETEPNCWRRYLGAGGVPEILKPDLYVLTASGEFEDHWFVEVDCATESLPSVLKKCTQYERYRRSGREQAQTGVYPRVVWVVPDLTRWQRLSNEIASTRSLDRDLFRITTHDDFAGLVGGGSA
jgi:hypothetical protein